jgi:hypothetical protein
MRGNFDGIRAQPSKGPIPQLWKKPEVCICSKPFVIDGHTCFPVSPSCEIHGIRSDYIPQAGHICQEKRVDAKRNTQVSGKAQ